MDRYRCRACGNRTRFDFLTTQLTRAFVHFDLGGERVIEEEEVLNDELHSVTCRWCGNSAAIEVLEVNSALDDDAPSVQSHLSTTI